MLLLLGDVMSVPLGPIVHVGDRVVLRGVESTVVDWIDNGIGTDDIVVLSDGRTCWASELEVKR